MDIMNNLPTETYVMLGCWIVAGLGSILFAVLDKTSNEDCESCWMTNTTCSDCIEKGIL